MADLSQQDRAVGLLVPTRTAQDRTIDTEDLITCMTYRYGFIAVQEYQQELVPIKELGLKKACRILAQNCWEPYNGPFAKSVATFISRCIDKQPPPLGLCDLIPGNPRGPVMRDSQPLKVVRIQMHDGSLLYGLEPQDERHRGSVPWALVVDSALSALEVLRRGWGPGEEDIVLQLVKKGIPFHTLQETSVPPVPRPVSTYWMGLGYRAAGYKPSPQDYVLYENIRDSLLSRPHARAALMMGGIVWRLACESVAPGAVLLGPSDDAVAFQTRSIVAWDDMLSEDELNVICGVYRVYTGKTKCIQDLYFAETDVR